ncbi:MAG: DJ-1/PfpI family protein [Cetobacterium sp.]|uniref:DJ-1/PfpI family protein n=1 Tax=unclassified Cetobacterium TaxID=2630983 RepID=UPI00163BED21|nr:DJ-1/PfpI family protein [Cetobacterium sp. 2A]MBC2856715.1 phosphoribosylformylglycinamidine synthase subunit PurQ [Cetobacterium sp. 2A]
MKKILLFLSTGFESLEAAPFIDVFGWNSVVGSKDISLVTCGFHHEILATWNLKIIPEINLSEEEIDINNFEGIIIPGGFGKANFFKDIKNPIFNTILHYFNEKNKYIIGICTGALAIGEAGLLKNIPATTYLLDNNRYFNQLEKYLAIPLRKEIVIYNNIITSSAPKTSIDVAFLILEKLTSEKNMKKVKNEMGF